MKKRLNELQRQQIRRAIRRATNHVSYDKQRVARWLEETILKGAPINVKTGAQRLRISIPEFYELAGRVLDTIADELRSLDRDL